MERTAVVAELQRIERAHPVFAIQMEGAPIWPLIRIYLGMRSLGNTSLTTTHTAHDPTNKIFALLRGLGQLAVSQVTPTRTNLLFFSNRTYQAEENGCTVDKFAHPLMEAAATIGSTSLLLNSDLDPIQPWKPVRSAQIRSVHYARRIRSKQFWRSNALASARSLIPDNVHDELARTFPVALIEGLNVAVHELRSMRRFYASLLDRIGPDHVFVTCWYSVENMAILHECHLRGIPTTDLQHGVQGPAHLAYAAWYGMPAEGCSVMPRVYWCWDEASRTYLDSWLPAPAHRAMLGGSPWLERASQSDTDPRRRDVLFTLQPIVDPIPPDLERAIRDSAPTRWTFRLHPNAQHMGGELTAWAERHGCLERIAIQDPRETSIAQALSSCAIHVTAFSSVIREAALCGVPSIALDPSAGPLYPDLVDTGLLSIVQDIRSLADHVTAKMNSATRDRDRPFAPLAERLSAVLR